MSTIANLEVLIAADVSALRRGMDEALGLVEGFGDKVGNTVRNFGADVTLLGANIENLTAPLRDFGVNSIQTAADFEASMAEISARTGLVGEDLQEISDFALQMGADTAFSGQQAADAFLQLLSSGQTAEQAISTLPVILDAAAASGEELGRSADVVTDIMAAFGLGVEDAREVVDALAAAAGASSADMSSLGQGFANVGGIAKNFGLSVEDTAAVLAIFAENGTKGAEAGTLLKSMLLNMSRDTDKVTGAWGELGVSMYDAAGNMRPLETVISDLDSVLDTMTIEEQNGYMQTLAGSYGIAGLTALRSSISITKMKDSMKQQADAATVAQARMDTFNGRIDSLKGSVETLMTNALMPMLEDFLSPMAEQATEVINVINDWALANPELSNSIIAVGAALAVAGPILVAVGSAIMLAAPAVSALAAAFALLISPVGLAIGALAGLQALGIIDIPAIFESVRRAIEDVDLSGVSVEPVKQKIADLVSQVDLSGLELEATTFVTAVQKWLDSIDLSGLSPDALKTKINDYISSINFSGLSFDFAGIQSAVTNDITKMDFTGVQSLFEDHFDAIVGLAATAAGIVFGGPVGLAIGGAKLLASAIENDFLGIGTFLNESGITASVETALSGIKTSIDGIIQAVFGGEALTPAAGGTEMSGPLALFVSDLKLGLDEAKKIIDNIWSNIKPGFDDLVEGIGGFVNAFADTETSGLLRVVTGVAGALGLLVGKALEIGSDIFGDVLSTIGNTLPKIGDAISSLISALSNVGEGDFAGVAKNIGDGILSIAESVFSLNGLEVDLPSWEEMTDTWGGIFDSLGTIVSIGVGEIEARLDDIAVGFRSVMRDVMQGINDARANVAAAQAVLGINYDENMQLATEFKTDVLAADAAKNLESAANAALAGNPIKLDVPTLIGFEQQGLSQEIIDQIADPTAIQALMDEAIAQGDTKAITALLPITLGLAEDPAIQMQELLKETLEVGGPNGQDAFNALLPMATELDIDTQEIVDQYDAALQAAAAAKVFDLTVTANVKVNTNLDMSGVGSAAQSAANAAIGSSGDFGGGGGSSESYGGGGSGRQANTVYITAYGQDAPSLVGLVERGVRDRDR